MGEKRWAAGETKVRRGSLRKEDGRVDVTPIRVDLCCLFTPFVTTTQRTLASAGSGFQPWKLFMFRVSKQKWRGRMRRRRR